MSTRSRQNKKTQALLCCNRKVLRLPDDIPAVHLQFTEYYFPDNPNIPGIKQMIYDTVYISDMFEQSEIFYSPLAFQVTCSFDSMMIIIMIVIVVVPVLGTSKCTHFPSSSTYVEPVRPGERPPVHCRSTQCAVDQSLLQGPAADPGPGQSVLSLTGQQQS